MKRVEIFTDGACSGNPGAGGWGAILRYNDVEKELSALLLMNPVPRYLLYYL